METIPPPLIDHQPRDTGTESLVVVSSNDNPPADSSALVHTNAPVDINGPVLPRFSELISRRHGLSLNAATALNLAVLSAAVGPCKTIKNPLGGTLNAGLNVIVGANAATRRAARQSMEPFQTMVEKAILAHQERGPKHRRQLRMELDLEMANASRCLRNPPEKVPEPFTIPVPREVRKMDALPAAVEHAKNVMEQARLFEFEDKPFVMADGFGVRDILGLPERTFDGVVLNFSPDALQQFDPRRDRDVLRYMKACWHGDSFVSNTQTVIAPTMTNLWLTDCETKASTHCALASSGLLETFLIVVDHDDPALEAVADSEAEEDWDSWVRILMLERIMGETSAHKLSEPSEKRFREFHTDQRRSGPDQKGTSWWPEHVLKIALIHHVSSQVEVPEEVEITTIEHAIETVECLGAGHLPGCFQSPYDGLEAEIEVMVTKLHLYGRMTKRDLFRKYNDQRYDRWEPILALCRERGRVEVDGEWISPVKALP